MRRAPISAARLAARLTSLRCANAATLLYACVCVCMSAGICTDVAAATDTHATPKRDPFARPAPPPAASAPAVLDAPAPPAPLHLRALVLNGARSLANIDGDVLAAGEAARDYRVLRIDARGVLITRAGKQQLLSMNEKEHQ